ncbi:hypothetical protein BSP36_211 [Bacillus phage BSP36]|uniref:Transmembrane Fragile-X-F protein n=1 Tax=Bacillus phage BSP38 TaxID=2283013 RepID=A0A345MK74_BPBSP|nr:hypothetical protein HWB82_gp104 [Bacillus phage BSP38]AXH71256.1 hypothetical protein BSP38_214 [Bacillus phage BSP38]AYJ75298.1 hypothetical protein BSP36_211 [Bacillus phage BSP36]
MALVNVNKTINHNNRGGGVGVVSLLTLIFVTLKLTGHITWSWWWVLSPLWISAGLVIALIAVVFVIALIAALLEK